MTAQAVFVFVLAGICVQRLLELRLARANARWSRERGAVEAGAAHYPAFVVLHTGWLAGMTLEAYRQGIALAPAWPAWLCAFLAAQGLRYWAIASLGRRWNTRILVLPGVAPERRGPYRWLAHPNYIAVAVELAAVPLLFGAWRTALVASLLNALLLLGVRIPAENRALRDAGAASPHADAAGR